MSRKTLIVAVGLSLTMTCLSAWRQQVFQSRTDFISIDVAVRRDKDPVAGLTSADFTLDDNGIRQDIEAISTEALPVDVTLVVDVSGSVTNDLERFRTTIRQMVTKLRPIDRIRIVSFGSFVRQIEPMQTPPGSLALDSLHAEEATLMTDGLLYALSWLPDVERRHLVVAFTDGSDTSSALDSAILPDIATRADAALHVVLAKNRGSTRPNERSIKALEEAALRTGGVVHPLDDALKAFEDVLADFRTSYVLRYSWHGIKRGGWHDVTVKVVRPGSFVVRARKGYFVAGTTSSEAATATIK